jgi:hypothetical protein
MARVRPRLCITNSVGTAYYREHLRSCCVLNWVRVAQFLVSCLGRCRHICMFVLSLFDIAASVFRLALMSTLWYHIVTYLYDILDRIRKHCHQPILVVRSNKKLSQNKSGITGIYIWSVNQGFVVEFVIKLIVVLALIACLIPIHIIS